MQRTEISTLGEFALIDHLTQQVKLTNANSLHGVGDDTAVLAPTPGAQTLVTTDLMLEGIHFDLTYTPLRHLGYKAVVSAISDIYAMNGTPRQITISLGISQRFSVEHLEELYEGVLHACQVYGVDLVGGDTSSSLTGLCLSMTCIGEAQPEEITYRSGAKPTDLLCVTGNLGAAYMGVQLLEREKRVFAGEQDGFEPDFAGREYLLERQLRPEARRDTLEALRQQGIVPTAMIDISDGLASDLLHLSKASAVGSRIYEERIPIDFETAQMAEEFNLNVTTVALNGGDDYELLFTVPLARLDDLKQVKDVRIIGYITEANLGNKLITRDGAEIGISAQGWHRASE